MSYVGVFRKVELNGEPNLVYTLTQATASGEALAVKSGGEETLFVCPRARIKFQKFKQKGNGAEKVLISSPLFSSTRSGDQQGESLLDCDQDKICKLPLVPHNEQSSEEIFYCGVCGKEGVCTSYYSCSQCRKSFHKECVESPPVIRHPSHPFHPLLLILGSTCGGRGNECNCCGISSSFFYSCRTCKLDMRPICAMKPIPLVENHPKSHTHPLTFFPTQASLVCHICAQTKNLDPTYICVQCVFVIHKGCIGYPHVIRISRHHHRISFKSSLPPGKLPCRVCHQDVDNNYGAYSCSKCGDAYFVHTKCALNPKIWDGKDLDGVPEEDDVIDDGEPFQRIADGVILHPFHSHNLRLKIIEAYDEKKICQGCAFPIYEGHFYSCLEMECDFILHDSCANAPRMKRHPLHPFPLTLNVATIGPDNAEGIFRCSGCSYYGTGFFYEHHAETAFRLDLRCASIIEPFDYQCHDHSLFLPLDDPTRCHACDDESPNWTLKCFECHYIICFRCATYPYKARYKHDDHFLTIRDGKKASDQVEWCEACEGKIEEVKERGYRGNNKTELRFYRCDECYMALHLECLLGVNINMKPHADAIKDYVYFTKYSFESEGTEWIQVWILFNGSLSRPICTGCNRRCPFPIVFRGHGNKTFCSWDCIGYATW